MQTDYRDRLYVEILLELGGPLGCLWRVPERGLQRWIPDSALSHRWPGIGDWSTLRDALADLQEREWDQQARELAQHFKDRR